MVAKRKGAGKGSVEKLKLKKETLRNLDVKDKARGVKGGGTIVGNTAGATCVCTARATNCNVSCVAVCGGGTFQK